MEGGKWFLVSLLALLGSALIAEGQMWTKINPTGTPPSPRYDFAYGYNNNTHTFYVFGGISSSGEFLGDFYKYDTVKSTWTQILNATGDPAVPPPSHGGAGVVVDNTFFLVGGEITPNDYLSAVLYYNDDGNHWNFQRPWDAIIQASAISVATQWENESIFYYGGAWAPSVNRGYNGNIFFYDGGHWWSIVCDFPIPPARALTAAAYAPNPHNRTVIFGGHNGTTVFDDMWFIFDMALDGPVFQMWYEIPKQYYPWPAARYGAFLAYSNSKDNGKLLLFGGGNSTYYGFDDLNVYVLNDGVWDLPPTVKGKPPGRMQGGLASTDKGLLIFGGIGGTPSRPVYFNDIWILAGI